MYFSKIFGTYHCTEQPIPPLAYQFFNLFYLKAAKVTKKGNSSDPKLPFLSLLALC